MLFGCSTPKKLEPLLPIEQPAAIQKKLPKLSLPSSLERSTLEFLSPSLKEPTLEFTPFSIVEEKRILNPDTDLTSQMFWVLGEGNYLKALDLADEIMKLCHQEKRGIEKMLCQFATLNHQAIIHQKLGHYNKALNLFEQAFAGYRLKLGEEHLNTMAVVGNLVILYQKLGRFDDKVLALSKKVFNARKKVWGEENDRTLIAMNNLAVIYQKRGEFNKALSLFEKNFALRENNNEDSSYLPETYKLNSLHNLASIHQNMGHPKKALSIYEKILPLQQEQLGETHPDTLNTRNELAMMYSELGYIEKALLIGEDVLKLRQEVLGKNHPDTLNSLNYLAIIYVKHRRFEEAIELLEQFKAGIETLRSQGELSDENRQAFFKQWIHGYINLSRLYLFRNQIVDAFHLSEMSKARTLLESMSIKLAVQKAGLNEDDQQKFIEIQTKLAALNYNIAKEYGNIEPSKGTWGEREKNQLVRQKAKFHHTLMQKYPKYAKLNDIQIVTAETGASLIPSDALFISYLTQGNHVLIFTLDSSGDLQAEDLGEIPKLKQTLKTYREWLGKNCITTGNFKCEGKYVWKVADGSLILGQEPDSTQKPKRVRLNQFTRYLDNMGRDLAQKLLTPIQARLQSKKRLIISPDGALAQIPFETLIMDDEPLIASHSVSYVQSLSVLRLLKEREKAYQNITDRGTLLAMGAAPYQEDNGSSNETKGNPNLDIGTLLTRSNDPQRYKDAFRAKGITWNNLPHSETELKALEDIFSDQQLLIFRNTAASEAKLQQLNEIKTLANYQYLVFSAHGHLDMKVPALSAIVLDQVNQIEGTDGYVTASEWPSYDLRSDLMVLSACQTGVGEIMQGEGVMGLPYAFYVAGNKNTLMTLWSVVDETTAEFVKRFFRKLNNGQSQIDALTETKREFLKEEELEYYTLPLFWAPFVFYGI